MNDRDLIDLWKDHDQKLETLLTVNRQQTIELTRLKMAARLASIRPIKWFAIIVGIAWCAFLAMVLGVCLRASLPFVGLTPLAAVVAGLLVINGIGVGIYIYHLVLLARIDRSASVLETQRELATLKASTLNVARILLLQLPFYASLHMFIATDAGLLYWIINWVILACFVVLTVWLFREIRESNVDKRWFRFIFGDGEWDGVVESIEMLKQLDGYAEPLAGDAG